jgi:hypothetical protein
MRLSAESRYASFAEISVGIGIMLFSFQTLPFEQLILHVGQLENR